MKHSFLVLFLFLFLSFTTSAQNYQSVQLSAECYFADSTGYVKAIRIETSYFNGIDSVYRNFFTKRDTGFFSILTCGVWVYGASWIGKEVILRNNGDNIFFNKDNDSLLIRT